MNINAEWKTKLIAHGRVYTTEGVDTAAVSGRGVRSGAKPVVFPMLGSALPRKNLRGCFEGSWGASSWRRRWSGESIVAGGSRRW